MLSRFGLMSSLVVAGCGGGSHTGTDAGRDAGSIACVSDRDCSAMGLVCDRGRGVCVECVAPADCSMDEICLAGDCMPRIECTSSRMCPGLVCDTMRGYCVQCVGPEDCGSDEVCTDGACIMLPPPECVTTDDCPTGLACVDARCVMYTCSADAECADSVFCNGTERCMPTAPSADAFGCVAGAPPCAASSCDEAGRTCSSCDADFDGREATGCGGDDCDDSDPMVFPGASERCDGIDGDCSSGGGPTSSEDADGDGYAPNDGSCMGGGIEATDCDDSDRARNPAATELCNAIDDDCDTVADEAPAGEECPAGASCFSGSCRATPSGGIVRVVAGASHACALHASGRVYCWGGVPMYGQLGDGVEQRSMADASSPVSGLTDATAISAGSNHTCALRAGGGPVCWGYAASGQIGDGEVPFSRPTPRAVIGLGGTVTQITGAGISTCARLSTGEVQCWGDSREGQIGDGTTMVRPSPVYVVGASSMVDVVGGYEFACARRADRSAICWGENNFGQLGDVTTEPNRLTPVEVITRAALDGLALGGYFTCGLDGAGVSCWGMLPGTATASLRATFITGTTPDAMEIAAGFSFACLRRATGTVECWGRGSRGELGNGMSGDGVMTTAPTMPVTGLTDAVQITAARGGDFACALRATGQVVCWGSNHAGNLGDGTMTHRSTPVAVLGLPP